MLENLLKLDDVATFNFLLTASTGNLQCLGQQHTLFLLKGTEEFEKIMFRHNSTVSITALIKQNLVLLKSSNPLNQCQWSIVLRRKTECFNI